jgi:NADH:ubiquinone reductase (H+-translocating)
VASHPRRDLGLTTFDRIKQNGEHTLEIVIAGRGFGGLSAVKRLKSDLVDVTLVDRRNYHLFQPLLYQVATGSLSPGDISAPLRTLYTRAQRGGI